MSAKEKRERSRIRNDIVLIVAIALIATILALLVFLNRSEGAWVTVTVDGKESAVYSLYGEPRTITVYSGENEEDYNVIVIENGKVQVIEANCPKQTCVRHRPVSYVDESIICASHGVVITVTDNNTAKAENVNE